MQTYLLDADTLIDMLRKRHQQKQVEYARLREVLEQDATVLLSPVVFYEVRRKLLQKDAAAQTEFMDKLSAVLFWDDLRRDDWEMAAEKWAECMARDFRPGDADTIIAAHASRHGAVVVTRNDKHFRELGVVQESWGEE